MTSNAAPSSWDIESIFPDFDHWHAEAQQVRDEIYTLAALKDTMGQGPEPLKKFLDAWQELNLRVNRLGIYTSMLISVDTRNTEARSLDSEAQAIKAAFQSELAFVEPELLDLGADRLKQWMVQHPGLQVYGAHFEKLWSQQQALRSTEIEALLGAVSDPFQSARSIHTVLVNELDFGTVPTPEGEVRLAHNTLQSLLSHPDRSVRKQAWEQYADRHLEVQQAMATAVSTGAKQHVFLARARGFRSTLEAALFPNRLPTSVYHNFMGVFEQNQALWHRYWQIRSRALRLTDFAEYDIKAPLSAQPPVVSYPQAVDFITEGMRPLGEEYVQVMRSGLLEDRWVDHHLTPTRRQGAYSTGNRLTKPFIFMSYQDSLYGMSTLAHEIGHSMHKHLSTLHQPPIYERYTLFAAEVASNFNQALVRAHLLNTATDRNFKIAVLEEAFSNFHRYFLVMPVLSRFEQTVHEHAEQGKTLSASRMNSLMAELLSRVYGNEVQLDTERNGIMWAQFSSHLYANYYCWQYGTGIAAASALAEQVLTEGEPAVQRYLEFLSLGGKLPPLEALKVAGVDLSTPEPIEAGFRALERLLDQLEALL